MQEVKCIATDLDGTFLTNQKPSVRETGKLFKPVKKRVFYLG